MSHISYNPCFFVAYINGLQLDLNISLNFTPHNAPYTRFCTRDYDTDVTLNFH